MSNDINLLHANRSHRSPVLERRVRIFRTISITSLFLVGVLSGCLFIIFNLSSLPHLKEEEKKLLDDFSSNPLRKKTDSYFLTKVRSEDISKLLSRRSRLMETYNSLLAFSTGDISVSGLQVGREKSVFSITSSSLSEIENMLVGVKKLPEKDREIQSISISSIEYYSTLGEYSVTVELVNKSV